MENRNNITLIKRCLIIFLLLSTTLSSCASPLDEGVTARSQTTDAASFPDTAAASTNESVSNTTKVTPPENAITNFSLTDLDHMLPVFDVALLSSKLYNTDGNPPLFPYTISEVISAESDEQGGDVK